MSLTLGLYTCVVLEPGESMKLAEYIVKECEWEPEIWECISWKWRSWVVVEGGFVVDSQGSKGLSLLIISPYSLVALVGINCLLRSIRSETTRCLPGFLQGGYLGMPSFCLAYWANLKWRGVYVEVSDYQWRASEGVKDLKMKNFVIDLYTSVLITSRRET